MHATYRATGVLYASHAVGGGMRWFVLCVVMLGVLMPARARAQVADCPIGFDAKTGFDEMNMFCNGRGALAYVGKLPFISAAPVDVALDKDGPLNPFKRMVASLTATSPGCGVQYGGCPDPVVFSSAKLHRLERDLGVVVDETGKRRGSLSGRIEGGIADEVNVTVAGCALCHTGRVAGKVYRGLGNKTIDVWASNRILHRVLKAATIVPPPYDWRAVERTAGHSFDRALLVGRALGMTRRMSHPAWASRTRGLVPDALVMWWFLGHAGKTMPDAAPRAEVKVPTLWGFATRRGECPEDSALPCPVPLFADGFSHGRGMLAGAELGADPYPGTLAYPQYQERGERIAGILTNLESAGDGPPAYPCRVDSKKRDDGKKVFAERCAGCHGDHEKQPRDPPEIKAIAKVGTDAERLRIAAASTGFASQPRCGPGSFCAEGRAAVDAVAGTDRRRRIERSRWDPEPDGQDIGYFAPRLDGIWARFPYLHNGSVPTLWHLLGPVKERPVAFDLTEVSTVAGFDPVRGGLAVPAGSGQCTVDPTAFATGAGRLQYCTARTGHSNVGHDFWWRPGAEPLSDADRWAVIEYLKTLGGGEQETPEGWCAAKGG